MSRSPVNHVASLAVLAASLCTAPGAPAASMPPPPPEQVIPKGKQVAVLAGGCFWGMEGVFEHVKGVSAVTSGYAGGSKDTANYSAVSSEKTRHAEAVRIVYDPAVISYGTLLRVYFAVAHDPTQLNRQTPDIGTSYRSAIFPQSKAQREVAVAYITELDKARTFGKPVATAVETGSFYPAESYHQDFMRRNPRHPYILRWDKPKLAKLKAAFPGLYRP